MYFTFAGWDSYIFAFSTSLGITCIKRSDDDLLLNLSGYFYPAFLTYLPVFTRCDEVASSLRMPSFFIVHSSSSILGRFFFQTFRVRMPSFFIIQNSSILGLFFFQIFRVCPMVTTFYDNFLTTFYDNFLTTFWQLLTTFWQLFDKPRTTSDKGWGGSPISRRKGRGSSLFLSWKKEFFEESSVKRSILTTLVATKD
jgi:hypothetical protein